MAPTIQSSTTTPSSSSPSAFFNSCFKFSLSNWKSWKSRKLRLANLLQNAQFSKIIEIQSQYEKISREKGKLLWTNRVSFAPKSVKCLSFCSPNTDFQKTKTTTNRPVWKFQRVQHLHLGPFCLRLPAPCRACSFLLKGSADFLSLLFVQYLYCTCPVFEHLAPSIFDLNRGYQTNHWRSYSQNPCIATTVSKSQKIIVLILPPLPQDTIWTLWTIHSFISQFILGLCIGGHRCVKVVIWNFAVLSVIIIIRIMILIFVIINIIIIVARCVKVVI